MVGVNPFYVGIPLMAPIHVDKRQHASNFKQIIPEAAYKRTQSTPAERMKMFKKNR